MVINEIHIAAITRRDLFITGGYEVKTGFNSVLLFLLSKLALA
jgi:hypothetical protein